jgi:hypothetical protein
MKNIKTLLFISVVAVTSCKEHHDPTFKKSNFYGKWETTEIIRYNTTPGDCPVDSEHHEYEFHPNSVLWHVQACSNFDNSMIMDYTYDGKNTITLEIKQDLKIIEIRNGTMKLDLSSKSERFATFTLKQVCKPIGAVCQDSKDHYEMGEDPCGKYGFVNWICQ